MRNYHTNEFSIPEQNNASVWKRFYIYQKERFPLLGHGLLVATFSFSAIAYSRICRDQTGFVNWNTYLIGIFTTISLFLLVRIFDEFKDAEDDAKYRKELPVPRGLVSLSELKTLGIIVAVLQIAVNLYFSPKMLLIYFIVIAYLSLMGKEFFVADWLKKHQFWYVTSHMFIIPLVDIYASGLDWLLEGVSAPFGLVFFFCVSYMNGIVLEVGRKIRTPEMESEGVLTYTSMLGIPKAISLWIGILFLTLCLSLSASYYADLGNLAYVVLGLVFVICAVPAILFAKNKTKSMAKGVEIASAFWTICMYFILGAAPMIQKINIRLMRFLKYSEGNLALNFGIGGKARNLYFIKELGLKVPNWLVIPQEELLNILPNTIDWNSTKNIHDFIDSFIVPKEFIDSVTAEFKEDTFWAVRSSAIDEDGSDFSFAGQFESYLFVNRENLAESIKKVWKSAFSNRVAEYRKNNNLKPSTGIAVIIQEMVDAQVAGVAFGINPTNGDRQAKLISSVYSLGEGLVSGELDSDNFIVKDLQIEKQISAKTHKIVHDTNSKSGTKIIEVGLNLQKESSLSEPQIFELCRILDLLQGAYGKPQDIEFAVFEQEIYLLQARPVTNLNKIADPNGSYILWDNSNIVESYPGVTTPLTFSFISKSYESAYKLFSGFMGVDEAVIKENERVFANTLGLINGRVYYNLKTWYHMLAMLPGYSINARFMEKMMGVKERFDIPETYRLSKGAAWWRIIKMAFKMYARFKSLPKRREAFMALLEETIQTYKDIDFEKKNSNELMELYLDFEKKLLNEWKAPLLNDFFAMIWFGMLQKRCEKYEISKNSNIHNDLLCGSSDIISIQPIHRTLAIATTISENEELKTLFLNKDEKAIWKLLSTENSASLVELKKAIDQYIVDFGERCIGELKLESISYTQEPSKFVKILKSYVETGLTNNTTSGNIEEQIRSKAEAELNQALKNKWLKKWRLKRTLKLARELVSSRENLRYDRTRAFGIVREIFSHLGKRFYSEGITNHPRDIFYLSKEEIFSFIEGTSVTADLKALILLRKAEFESYKNMNPASERFATFGPVYHANDFFSTTRVEKMEGDLKGIGCCPGRVKGKVRVILNPDEISSLEGDILVTSSTDPGWVTLFPSASAIIVERGSLLSHSAIVSREMGKPCIVSVTGLLKTLKTGDEIEIDGGTGEIKIISKADA